MAMTIRNYLDNPSVRMSDDESFRKVFEDHITYFKDQPTTLTIPVTDMQLYVYEFSWIGLLNELGVNAGIHWFVIRLNGGESYIDVPKGIDHILLPDAARIKTMYSTHISRKTKKK